ncbi:MAG: dephospho-CoA kinase [Chloroflexota bacterium]
MGKLVVIGRTGPYKIGLTGNIACGKSTIGALLVARGAEYIDADHVVHELMRSGTPETERIVARFGEGVRAADGGVDRKALGALVWGDPAALRDLEQIMHPGVRAEIRRRVAASTAPVVVVDAIKLIESGLYREMDALWVVVCPREEQVRRLVETRGMTREHAAQRIDVQPPQEEKARLADLVIDNGRSRAEAEAAVERAWRAIPRS